MIGFYDYTVILTYCSLLSAIGGMTFAFHGRLIPSILCLLLCGLFDMFDGKVARTKKNRTQEEKSFGIQIDSLSDVVAFGVLPAVIAICISNGVWYVCLTAGLYALAGLIRLAYFNVTEEIRQASTNECRKTYAGLPITSAALIFPAFFGIMGVYCLNMDDFTLLYTLFEGGFFTLLLASVLVITGLLFIVPIRVRKPRTRELWIFLVIGVLLAALLLGIAVIRGNFGWFGNSHR